MNRVNKQKAIAVAYSNYVKAVRQYNFLVFLGLVTKKDFRYYKYHLRRFRKTLLIYSGKKIS